MIDSCVSLWPQPFACLAFKGKGPRTLLYLQERPEEGPRGLQKVQSASLALEKHLLLVTILISN